MGTMGVQLLHIDQLGDFDASSASESWAALGQRYRCLERVCADDAVAGDRVGTTAVGHGTI